MLRCRRTFEAGGLRLHLELENATESALWVASALPRPAGAGLRMDEEAAYVRPVDSGVVVTRHLLPIPEGVLVERPEVPAFARVAPGDRYIGRFLVPWPLVRQDPYAPKPPAALGTPSEVICEIGYLVAEGDEPPRAPGLIWPRQILARTPVDLSPLP